MTVKKCSFDNRGSGIHSQNEISGFHGVFCIFMNTCGNTHARILWLVAYTLSKKQLGDFNLREVTRATPGDPNIAVTSRRLFLDSSY